MLELLSHHFIPKRLYLLRRISQSAADVFKFGGGRIFVNSLLIGGEHLKSPVKKHFTDRRPAELYINLIVDRIKKERKKANSELEKKWEGRS